MIFSKKTWFAAALLTGIAFTASAADETTMSKIAGTWTDNVQGNVIVDSVGEIVIRQGEAYTLNGSFLSGQGKSVLDTWYWDEELNDGAGAGALEYENDAETITISGGGTLEYAGTVGSGYYTDNYTLSLGDKHTDNPDVILEAWKGFDSFASAGVFTGTVVVEGAGTTLNLHGQLSQYVGLYKPNNRNTDGDKATKELSGYWGASVELKGGAVLSFEQSTLNLADTKLSSNLLATKVNALNYVMNLKSDAVSTLRIGTDEGSRNRIVLYSDLTDGEISTVGRLAGNGRLYVMGTGDVAFIGESELNSGDDVADTTGHTWIKGNRLADIILGNKATYVGANVYGETLDGTSGSGSLITGGAACLTDKEALAVAVDNVFANATAIQLGAYSQSYPVSAMDFSVKANNTQALVTGSMSGADSNPVVTIYGNQVFNNFQSLFLERSLLLSNADLYSMSIRYSEPYAFSYSKGGADVRSYGSGTFVRVGGGSVLTINQDEYCDGWYTGNLSTSGGLNTDRLEDNGEGLVVKTGQGRFYYNQSTRLYGDLTRLRIEEGTWISDLDGISSTKVELADEGILQLYVQSKTSIAPQISGSGAVELTRIRFFENDLTESSKGEVGTIARDEVGSAELEYRSLWVTAYTSGAAGVQFVNEQSQFTGSIVVYDGLQLILGEYEYKGIASPSIFSSAESIVLSGVGDDEERLVHDEVYDGSSYQRSSLSVLSGVQLVRNLTGSADHSAVTVERGATLVLTRTNSDTAFAGTLSGNGNLVNLGGVQTINSTGGDLFGALTSLSGSLSVNQVSASGGFSGLILANGSSASFSTDGYAKVGALIGQAGTTVSVTGDFTVGVADATLNGDDGEYFATARYEKYADFFAGTSLETFRNNLETAVNNSRGTNASYDKTLAYIKNPAQLIYTTDETVYNGAFSKIFATTKFDIRTRSDTILSAMKDGAEADGKNSRRVNFVTGMPATDTLFSGEKTAAEWLRNIFDVENVAAFINSDEAQLSSKMKADLIALAEQIASGAEGVCAYLDSESPSTANLNVEGWNKIVAAGGLEYLKKAYPYAGFDNMADETLYSVITNFYAEGEVYQFQITERNTAQIEQIYGVSFPTNPDYDDFRELFGYSSTDFAGDLSGNANLIKIGTETLTLTGENLYTGKTLVRSGELRIDFDAIKYTSGIEVKDGALLTINATKEEIADLYRDENGDLPDGYDDNTVGDLFDTRAGENSRLIGNGVVMKVGDGTVDLNNAVLTATEDGSKFKGTFLVAEGGLIATVDAEKHTPEFDVVLNKQSGGEASFRLAFDVDGGAGAIVHTEPDASAVELTYKGTITGDGLFVLDAGTSVYIDESTEDAKSVLLGKNVLAVSASDFSPAAVEIASGALRIDVNSTQTLGTKSYKLGADTDLTFNLNADATIESSKIVGTQASGTETLRIASTRVDDNSTMYDSHTLTLDKVSVAGIDVIELVGGANVVITDLDEDAEASEKIIELSVLTTDAEASLDLASGRTIELTGEKSVLAGTLTGTGNLVFGGKTLVLGNTNAVTGSTQGFSGTIGLNTSSTIEMNAGEGNTVEYTGLSLTGTDDLANGLVVLSKSGKGTVKISAGADADNVIDVKTLSIDVQAGTLSVGMGLFKQLPKTVTVEKNATFVFADLGAVALKLEDLGTLYGSGTVSFEKADAVEDGAYVTAGKNVDASIFTGVINVGEKVTLTLDSSVEKFSAFSGTGTIIVKSEKLAVTVDANADGALKFTGELVGLKELTALGDGALVLGSDVIPDELNQVTVGSATQNGGFGIQSSWGKTINAVGATSRVLLTGGGDFSGTVSVGSGVENLVLLREGTLDFSNNTVAKSFNLKTETGSALALDGSMSAPNVTLGNVAGTSLALIDFEERRENIDLQTNAGGELIFTADRSTYSLRAANDAERASGVIWDKDIAGAGGITVDTVLRLNAETLSYTGKTLVKNGAVLTYGAANPVSYSSGLEVERNAVVSGGVSFVAEGSDVVFNDGANFEFDGNAIEFTGTATAYGTIHVTFDSDALNERGKAVALFRYIGTGDVLNKNGITFEDNIRIQDSGGLTYLKDTANPADTGATLVYLVAEDLANAGVELHDGTSVGFIDVLNDISQTADGELKSESSAYGIALKTEDGTALTSAGLLAEAIIKTPNGTLAGTLNNLSPLSYGAMLALPQSGFVSDMATISSRIEQRRYDSYTQFAWEIHNDWEFFAQAQGMLAEAEEGEPDTRTFDMNTYGAIAGADVKLSATSVAGFAVAYDYGEADIHNGGGDIKSHDVRATAFFGKLFAERFYLDTGVQAGFAMFDTKRNTVLGKADGDTTGWHAGAFANFGMLIPLLLSEDEKVGLNLMPYIGLAYSYYGVSAFDESGADTALDTDSFGDSSLRATVGASLALTFPWLEKTTRVNLDFAYTHELLDTETDIDYTMPGISGSTKFTASAPTFVQDTFSVGPRFSIDLSRNTSVYAGYRFEMSTDSDTAHSVNVGFRSRF